VSFIHAAGPNKSSSAHPVWSAVIEIVLLIFFFYSARSMGEFTATDGRGKSIAFALGDIFTGINFVIAVISTLIGYVVFEYLRKRL
jgi:predicted membrane protein